MMSDFTDAVLGVKFIWREVGLWRAPIILQDHEVDLVVVPAARDPLGTCYLPRLCSVVKQLMASDASVRETVADQLLEQYNYEHKSPSDPILTRDKFIDQLQLTSIHIDSHGTVTAYFEARRLFGSQSVQVTYDEDLHATEWVDLVG